MTYAAQDFYDLVDSTGIQLDKERTTISATYKKCSEIEFPIYFINIT